MERLQTKKIRNNCNYTHTRCKQSQHASSGLMIRGWLAWGSANTPGRSAKRSRKDLPETVLSRRRLFTVKGKMVIFTVWKHNEHDTNGKSSTNREHERWNHLDRSYERKVVDVHFLGRKCTKSVNVHKLSISAGGAEKEKAHSSEYVSSAEKTYSRQHVFI